MLAGYRTAFLTIFMSDESQLRLTQTGKVEVTTVTIKFHHCDELLVFSNDSHFLYDFVWLVERWFSAFTCY